MSSVSDRYTAVANRVKETTDKYNRSLAVVERLQQQLARHTQERDELSVSIDINEKAQAVLVSLEEAWRKDFERSVEQIVTEGIQLVFGESLEFSITTSIKSGASAIEFNLETPNGPTDIMTAEGGSLVQVVSFLLRVLIILAHRPLLRRTIILDEAFAGLDEDNVPNLAALLRKIVDETGIQIIMVTHDKSYTDIADAVFEVKKNKGIAKVVKL